VLQPIVGPLCKTWTWNQMPLHLGSWQRLIQTSSLTSCSVSNQQTLISVVVKSKFLFVLETAEAIVTKFPLVVPYLHGCAYSKIHKIHSNKLHLQICTYTCSSSYNDSVLLTKASLMCKIELR
jgi:hypothetical protein